jgi:outer membrane protein
MSIPCHRKLWLALAAAVLPVSVAQADSLPDALIAAYQNNPTLNAERAQLRATDEDLARAQSGYRPSVEANADYGVQSLLTGPSRNQSAFTRASIQRNDGITKPAGFNIVMTQPLFRGFQVENAVSEANASIMAERQQLVDVEQRTLMETTRAYLDVLRDSANVALRANSVKLFSHEASATAERFAVGEMTRTDVAQARARQAEAEASLSLAKAQLRGSLADYERLVGHIPKQLRDPARFEVTLPKTLDEAVAAAMSSNPKVLAAAFSERAAKYTVRKALGEMLPDVRLQAQHSERFDSTPWIDQQITQSVVARVNVPLYQSGEVEARIRQAKQQHQSHLEQIEAARTKAKSDVVSAFAEVQAAREQVAAVKRQAEAVNESLAGVREEQRAGQRTLLDVLNAEQDKVNADVAGVRARHDYVIAGFSLLMAMGRLTAADLGLDVPLYDVGRHYAETNRKWIGLAVDHEPGYAGADPGWSALASPAR